MTNAALTALAALVSVTAAAGCSGRTAGATTTPQTYRISGVVFGAIAAGVTVTLTGASSASTTTSGTGDYAFDGLADGTYTVAPSMGGFTFSPVSQVVVVNGAPVTGQNFTATAVGTTYTIAGTVSGTTVQGITVTLSGTASGTTATAADGTYSFTGIADGTYTVTPYELGYEFSPSSLTFAVSGANATGNDFVASTSTSTAPVLDAGFPKCQSVPWSAVGSITVGPFSTPGATRTFVLVSSWYPPFNDPWPLTVAWEGGAPAGATTWTRRSWPNDGTIHWTGEIWTANTTSTLTNVSVTTTRANFAAENTTSLVCIYSFANAATTFGAIVDHHSPMSDVAQNIFVPADVTITATANNSWLVGIGMGGETYQAAWTPRANTTIDGSANNPNPNLGDGGAFAFHMSTPATTTASTQYTIGAIETNRAYVVEAIEVLAP